MEATDGMREQGVYILWFCEEDLLALGFSRNQITNERFERIVDQLRRYYIDSESDVLCDIATGILGDPEDKEDEDEDEDEDEG